MPWFKQFLWFPFELSCTCIEEEHLDMSTTS
jgi:hypothetical protein